MNIITVGREFGSGGRELGKRLADELGYRYFDKEIISAVAEKTEFDENYVANVLENNIFMQMPLTFGRSFYYAPGVQNNAMQILVAQQKIIKELAKNGNCVVVGRCADVILEEYKPFNIFVYASLSSKVERCRKRSSEEMSDRELIKKIKQIDQNRMRLREIFSDVKWGRKEAYHMCINTSDTEIKTIVPSVSQYIKKWFEGRK